MKNYTYIDTGGKKTIILLITLLFILCSITPVINSQNVKIISYKGLLPLDYSESWWNTDWEYRKEITINHSKVDARFINFPVLISLNSDVNLANNAQNDGDDILFTNKKLQSITS